MLRMGQAAIKRVTFDGGLQPHGLLYQLHANVSVGVERGTGDARETDRPYKANRLEISAEVLYATIHTT